MGERLRLLRLPSDLSVVGGMRLLLLLACLLALVLPAAALGGFSDGGDRPADLCPPPAHLTAGDACLPCTVEECR